MVYPAPEAVVAEEGVMKPAIWTTPVLVAVVAAGAVPLVQGVLVVIQVVLLLVWLS